MRSIWKGHIRFSLVTIPIQIFNAIDTGNTISFNQLHKEDNGRVGYKKVCKSCNEELSSKDIIKGYEYDADQYVTLDNKELENLKLKSDKAIEIEAFIDAKEVHPSRYETVHYIGPEGEVAKKSFQLLNQALKKTNKAAVGRIILRDKEDVALIVPEGNGMIMYKLRFPHEVRDIKKVPDLDPMEVNQAELDMAETLMKSLTTTFDKIDFEDRYHAAITELIQRKIDGKEIISIAEEEAAQPTIDIMDALKASIEQAKSLKKGA